MQRVDASIKIIAGPLFFASYGAGGTLQTGKFDVGFFGWFNGADPDDSTQFMCDQFPPAGQNVYHFCDRQLDALERTAFTSFDLSVRREAYFKIQEILADQAPTIFVTFTRRISVFNTDFHNYKPSHAVSTISNPWEWEM